MFTEVFKANIASIYMVEVLADQETCNFPLNVN
jgi:hypothetical protein